MTNHAVAARASHTNGYKGEQNAAASAVADRQHRGEQVGGEKELDQSSVQL